MGIEHEGQSTSIPALAHGQLCYLQIPALDASASARFYKRVFGWRLDPPAEFEAPMLIGQWITNRPPAPESGPVAWVHVTDVQQTLREATEAGATVQQGPTPDGPRVLASFCDPAGNLVGLAQHDGSRPAAGTEPANRTMPACTVIPELVYDDVIAAIDWLCDTFGFVERWRAGDHRAQLLLGDSTVVITEPRTSKALAGRHSLMVRVSDADAHLDHVRSRGANVIEDPRDFPYGERQYTVEDPGGHHWTFSQSIADKLPEQWRGVSGPALRQPPAIAAAGRV